MKQINKPFALKGTPVNGLSSLKFGGKPTLMTDYCNIKHTINT